jgi:two-component system, chemotaxis family, CheB/CheR fusion protein
MPKIELAEFVEKLAIERYLDLRGYKHSTLERRLRKRMAQLGINDLQTYLGHFAENPDEKNRLLDNVLINVTEFFRDPQAWDIMANKVVPHLLRDKRPGESFRAWFAGCASGEEVYTLAILIADYLGDRLPEFDIKLYATDTDEDALNTARRGEYSPGRLRRLSADWKNRFFHGAKMPRINREIRRMVIFGRNDLVHDAPISHVELLVCRNVLIYFDAITQQQILARFHYALEENGILFLGKAESKLSDSRLFAPLHARWRIFRRSGSGPETGSLRLQEALDMDDSTPQAKRLHLMEVYQRAILDALAAGVMVLDEYDNVIVENEALLALWGLRAKKLTGKRLQDTIFVTRCPELAPRLEESRTTGALVRFTCDVQNDGHQRVVQLSLRPINGEGHPRLGTLIHAEDVSHREQLQKTIEQLESTGQELQSANEELETTNEELQSTNEELETTNEELQSTNEELETTNEELQSLNEELENMNEELEYRTRELDSLNSRYSSTLEQMPWPILTVEKSGKLQFWNSAAERLFGIGAKSVIGLELGQLPIPQNLRKSLSGAFRDSSHGEKAITLRKQLVRSREFGDRVNVSFTPLARDGSARGALIMFVSEDARGIGQKSLRMDRDGVRPTAGKNTRNAQSTNNSKNGKNGRNGKKSNIKARRRVATAVQARKKRS